MNELAALLSIGFLIVLAFSFNRCALTKQATEELICLGWMKLVKYEPIELLKHMAVSENDTICDTVVSILLKAASTESTILSGLSEAEVRAFRQGIDKATATLSEDIFSDNSMITGPRLFMSVTACKHAATQREKDMLINQLVPDMAVLCQYLDQNAGKLIQAIEEDNQEAEDELVFICVQLMRLAVVADVEEGSRRLLATALQRLLVSVITPDDLVEEAVCTLQSISRDDSRFMDQISSTVREVDDLAEHDDELAVNRQLRILAILSIVFERITPDHCSKNTLDEFSRQITPSLSKSNQLVREAGVSCLGKLGLFMATNTVENEYQPMMLEILSNEEEKHEVRAQAMLALADWSLLNELHPRFAEVISRALHREGYPEGLVLVAAEVATKLLLVGKIHNHNWLAALLVLLFDPSTNLDDDEEEDDDILQVGNPIRVQQVLTVFFPAYCIRQESAKQEMVRCISPAIDTAANKRKNKKHASRGTGRKPSRAAWPMSKMLDYVLSSTEQEAEPKEEDDDETPDMNTPERGGSTNKKNETSVALLVTIQVALYLEKSMDDLSVTLCRALFKWIGSVDIDVSTEQPEHLSKLRRSLDELEMATSDSSSLRSLAPLMEQLSDVSAEEENDDSSSEGGDTGSPESAASLVEGFENFGINAVETPTYAKENEFASAATSDKADLTFDRRVSLESRSVNRA